MTWRGLTILVCVSAFAQLPRSQAPMPREDPTTPGRIDASVTDLDGRPIADLKAADFTLEASGKPQKIDNCRVEQDQPLRLAVLIDDVSLPLDRLNNVRRTLREFVANGLREGDELAILRAGAGSGGNDGFTSDKAALQSAIDRARFNPASENSAAEDFAAATINAARGVLEGMRDIPGRKALLLVSERLGEKERSLAAADENRLARPAHRAATVLYAFDAAPVPQPALEQGFAAAVNETGGRVFSSGDLASALARIAQEQRTYYVLTFSAAELSFDYIARAPRVEKVALRTARPNAVVRARNGHFADVSTDYEDPDSEFASAVDSDELDGGIRARITAFLSMATGWQVEAVVHLDTRDLTFIRGADGLYRTRLDTAVALLDPQGKTVKDSARTFQAQLNHETWTRYQNHGLDFTVILPVPLGGAYAVYAAVRDSASGRIGTTRQFLRAPDLKDSGLLMSSIVIRGDLVKSADGAEVAGDPLEGGAVRSFRSGRRVNYAYSLFNVAADAEKRSEIETHSEIWRDGVRIYNAEPRQVAFPASDTPGRRSVGGALAISEAMAPGGYLLRVTVLDRLTKRSVSQWMDFEVRP